MSAKITWIFIALFCTVVFSWSVYRDMQSEKQYVGDLRNRVVGARVQKDGLSPYFYKWKKGDGLRYYDPSNFDSLRVSNITASPFFHRLLYPVADLPEHSINIIWLIAEYVMLITMVMLSLSLATTKQQQWMVLIAACLFLLTAAWKMHIDNGQNYICIPFLALLFYYSANKKNNIPAALVAGLCAILLVLIRPNAVFFFIPFLWMYKHFSRKYIFAFLLPVLLVCSWEFFNKQERFFWKDYKALIEEQVKLHQDLGPTIQANEPSPKFIAWEGIGNYAPKEQNAVYPAELFSENANVFVIFKLLFHKKLPVWLLSSLSIFTVIAAIVFFLLSHRKNKNYTLTDIALLGYSLYMITDLFSPVHRWQYYTVQWMFPIMIAASAYKPVQQRILIILATGVVLNILNIRIIPMEHSIGEYCMLLGSVLLSAGIFLRSSPADKIKSAEI